MKRFPSPAAFVGLPVFFILATLCYASSCCGQLPKEIKKNKAARPGAIEAFAAEMAGKKAVPPPPTDKAAFDRYVQEGWDSPFGIDYVFIHSPEARDPAFVYDFGGVVGIRWANFTRIQWSIIERRAPRNGVHTYDWTTLDDGVRKWQHFGVHAAMTLFSHNGWATATPSGKENVYLKGPMKLIKNLTDYLPKPEHMQDYRDYITALVERYDGDGVNDMPGLLFPVLHYQIGNEYNNEAFWGGSVEEYGVFLKESYQAAKKANPQVKILLSGVNFAEHTGFYEEKMEPQTEAFILQHRETKKPMADLARRMTEFSLKSITYCDAYDILDVRWAYYGVIKTGQELLRKAGCPDKEIWSGEAYSHYPLVPPNTVATGFLVPYPGPSESKPYLDILKNKRHPKFKTLNAWYRGLQAAHLIKQLMVALSGGSRRVMMGYAADTQSILAPSIMPIDGLRSNTFSKLWPVAYAYRQVMDKLDGVQSCRRLPLPTGIFVYENTLKSGKKVYVAFYDDFIGQNMDQPLGTAAFELPFPGESATVTGVITGIDQTVAKGQPVKTHDGKLPLLLTEYPVFIEANGREGAVP